MRIRQDFDPADPSESEVYSFDYTAELGPTEELTGATFSIALVEGVDADPASRLDGAASVGAKAGGTRDVLASQRLTSLQPGARYRLSCLAETDADNTISLYAHVTCKALEDV